MDRFFFSILLFMLSSLSVVHGSVRGAFGVGYRVDQQKYTLSSFDIAPISELKWNAVQSVEAVGDVEWVYRRYHLGLEGAVGQIFDGAFIDSDWAASGRQFLISKTSSTVEGNTFDLDLRAGFDLFFGREGGLIVRPLMGASYHNMYYKNRNLSQEIFAVEGFDQFGDEAILFVNMAPRNLLDGIICTHHSQWLTGWVGFDLIWQVWDELTLRGSLRGHGGVYQSIGDWRERADLASGVSFKNQAMAGGIETRLGGALPLLRGTSVFLDLRYRYFETTNGNRHIFWSDDTYSILPFDGAMWSSFQLIVGLLHSF